jgi:hypothetical protein
MFNFKPTTATFTRPAAKPVFVRACEGRIEINHNAVASENKR